MCKRCLQTIESKTLHDFKFCSCGSVGIDGGIAAGNRILGDLADIEMRSLYCAVVQKKKIWLPPVAMEEYFREIGRTRRRDHLEKIEVSEDPEVDSTTDNQAIVKPVKMNTPPTMNTPKKCDLCFKDDFRTISPEPGVLVRICSDHMSDFTGLNCGLCTHHHHHPDNAPACVEFRVLLEGENEQPMPEWANDSGAANDSGEANVVIDEDEDEDEEYQDWFEEHQHHGRACTSRHCIPCPGCGGVYDGDDYGGHGCSRDCAYHRYDDHGF